MVGEQAERRDVFAFYALTGFAAFMYAVPGEWIPALAPLGYAALWVVMGAAIVSAVDYYRRFQRLVNARVTDVNIVRERREAERRTAHRER